jgi:hypothetical protein
MINVADLMLLGYGKAWIELVAKKGRTGNVGSLDYGSEKQVLLQIVAVNI